MSNKTFEFLKLQPSRVANVYVAKTTSDVKYEKYEQEEQMNASLSFRNFRSSEVGGWVRVFLKRYVLSLPAGWDPWVRMRRRVDDTSTSNFTD